MYVPDPIFTPDGSDFFAVGDGTPPTIHTPSTGTTSSSGHSKNDALFQSMTLHGTGSRQTRTLAPNLTRRSHKKSRAGCFTCKTRKIKCGEQKPKCGNCLLKGLNCIYPASESQKKRDAPLPLAKRVPTGVSPGTAAFTLQDMRFFHHFLTTAYPHLPLGNDHIWVNEIPQFAEEHEYLMHALLSLGASHLGRVAGTDFRKESLIHRGLAIAGLNQALSQKAQNYGEGDAMVAACYALTFQASYMGDGLADFITMVRGCALTTGKVTEEEAPTAFNLQPDWHYKVMAPRLQNLPQVNPILLEEGVESLDMIRPYMVTELDESFHQALINVVTSLLASPQSGYSEFIGVYAVWYELCHDSFKAFLDPNNIIAQMLLAYFIGIQMLMVPLAAYEFPERANSSQAKVLYGMVEWADGLFERIEATPLGEHLRWPKRIVRTVVAELGGDFPGGPSVLRLDLPISQDGSPADSPFEVGLWADNMEALKMMPELMPDMEVGIA